MVKVGEKYTFKLLLGLLKPNEAILLLIIIMKFLTT